MKRRLIIGDIHAHFDAMKNVLHKAGFNPETDILYSVGDFCDRGDKPFETLEYLMRLGDAFRPVLGNHDAWLEYWLHTGTPDWNWTLRNGGNVTLEKLSAQSTEWLEKLKDWLGNIPLIRVEEKDIIVHGGIPEGITEDQLCRIASEKRPVPIYMLEGEFIDLVNMNIDMKEYERLEEFYWNRDYILSALRAVYGENPMRRTQLREPFNTERTIWVGHSQLASGKPFLSSAYHLAAIDTGIGSGRGPITVVDMDTREYWQAGDQ